ncbi:acyltransferase family protein [Nitzschia inconspicua]|uniref:Acyltransferase family protein n=1 Tax=Nitzschia inconspicua TaxID=303405 RepID=A0A9K3KST6_9STRA|nr:acyltransferase family protein [Nitzschia inconspicua]
MRTNTNPATAKRQTNSNDDDDNTNDNDDNRKNDNLVLMIEEDVNGTTTTTDNNSTTTITTSTTTIGPLTAAALRQQERIHNLTEAAAAASANSNPLDRWQPQPRWSISPGGSVNRNNNDNNNTIINDPDLTSSHCYDGLVQFFTSARWHPNGDGGKKLALATEASSHPSGLLSVYAQPWIYAGPGLGNMDECPLQVCLAGGTGRDSLTFASVCVIPHCDASDMNARDFVERLETAASSPQPSSDVNTELLIQEYIRLNQQIAQIGQFLGTGWVCGEYKVDWELVPSILWGCCLFLCVLFSLWGTFGPPSSSSSSFRKSSSKRKKSIHDKLAITTTIADNHNNNNNDYYSEETIVDTEMHSLIRHHPHRSSQYSAVDEPLSSPTRINGDHHHPPTVDLADTANKIPSSHYPTTTTITATTATTTSLWSAWNMHTHLRRLIQHRPETACLDGLKVGSILWIIAAHVMAIQSSTAAGYLNPIDFLPPHGITTTVLGQLLFSSRYAVDTFLCISGFLAVHVLNSKLNWHRTASTTTTTVTTRCMTLLGILVMRLLRILPLYVFCLGFWMYIAPHLGSGPFWYQWENFLEPCRNYWWTNLLFVNNFLPWGVSTTANCFYHSWYLAVDVQLFFLFGPWLVLLYQRSSVLGKRVAALLWMSSVVVTAVLSYTQGWSVNTFDGAAVALFDVEGYAKPHVRAQSYMAGILVAMRNLDHRGPKRSNTSSKKHRNGNSHHRDFFFLLLTKEGWIMTLAIFCLIFLSFVTVTGAYSRRACTFEELPAFNDCGSIWSPMATFLYTAFSRAIWSICIATIMAICLKQPSFHDKKEDSTDDVDDDDGSNGRREHKHLHNDDHPHPHVVDNPVKFVLSWNVWTPLAHLSYGAYLIHPIVIFVWKLGGREKTAFRVLSFVMDFCSITVFTFLLSLFVALVVEFPFGMLLHPKSPLVQMLLPLSSSRSNE